MPPRVREAGATTVYITHDQAEAFALADHIGVLEEGVLVQRDGPPDRAGGRRGVPRAGL
jgi:ABC-type sugar transport system ATPase subunit